MANVPQPYQDEVDIYDLLKTLWQGKLIISAFILISLLFGLIFILSKNAVYESRLYYSIDTLPPIDQDISYCRDANKLNDVALDLYGKVKVALKHFSNPQVMYGVSTVIENQGSKCSGLLVREYKANTMELSNIMLKHYMRGVIPRTKGQCQNVFMRAKKAN